MQSKQISFKGQKVFVGIDVHKTTWSVTVLLEVGVPKTHPQKASAKELFDFLNKHYPDGEYHAVYEAGFSGYATYYALNEYGIHCIVVNAADVPTTQYENVMKSDPIDSVKLAKALRAGQLKGIYIRNRENLDDRAVVRYRGAITKEVNRYRTRVKHLLHSNGVDVPERFDKAGHWSGAYLEWLRTDVTLLSSTRLSLDLLLDQAEIARKGLLKATLAVRHLSQSPKYADRYNLLHSIPGIGPICGMTILTEVEDITRFRNEKQFASYLGLIPTCHSSGDKVVHGEKTFRGNKQIGPMLVEASWRAIYADDALASAFLQYKHRGFNAQEAIIRIARKMSNIILSVLKSGKPYEPFMGYTHTTAE